MKTARLLFLAIGLLMLTVGRAEAQIHADTSGLWSNPATWAGDVVPTAADNVVIDSARTVTIDVASVECNDLTVRGYLFFDLLNSGYRLTAHGNVTIHPAARLRAGGATPVAPRAHEIVFEKDLTNLAGGSFDMRVGSGANVSVGRVVFAGTSNSVLTLSLTTYGSSVEEFNTVVINKTASAKVVLAAGNLFQNNNTTNSPDTLILTSGIIETGPRHWAILRTSSASIVGASAASYVVGYIGRGVSNGGGTSTIDFPVGDSVNYRPVNVRLNAPPNATGHYVWAKAHAGNANTGTSAFVGGIDKVSALRYAELGYLQNAGTSATMGFYGFGPSYSVNDGVNAGNTDLRVAYSTDARATWTNVGPASDTTDLTTPPTTILGDSIGPAITLNTGNSIFVSLARATGTTTNTLGNVGTGVGEDETVPDGYSLQQNYPNPFNPETRIEFSVPERSHVRIAVFNLLGQEIAVLADNEFSAGTWAVSWNGKDASGRSVTSGTYFYRMRAGTHEQTLKAVLVK
jgi:hypothetical protein